MKQDMHYQADFQHLITQVMPSILGKSNFKVILTEFLAQVGQASQAQEVFFLELDNFEFEQAIYSWTRENQLLDASLKQTLLDQIKVKEAVLSQNVGQDMALNADLVKLLEQKEITTLALWPLLIGDKLQGFWGILGPHLKAMTTLESYGPILTTTIVGRMVQKQLEAKLLLSDQLDTVTKTYNLVYFFQETEKVKKQITAIVHFNFLDFQLYNASHSIEEGNTLLTEFGQLLQTKFSTKLVTRLAADNFVVGYQGSDTLDLVASVHQEMMRRGQKVEAGIYFYQNQVDVPTACDFAQAACRKNRFRANTYWTVYSEELREEMVQARYLRENLDQAIAAGHLKIHYQPIVRVLTGKPSSLEALTRWHDPRYGLLGPSTYVPILEASHLCYKVDMYVIEKTCQDLRQALDAGRPVVPVAINLSRDDFEFFDCVDYIETTLQRYGLDRRYLRIEITESTAMENPKLIQKAIMRLHQAGYSIWMDDFGSAYSSLNTLKDFAFDGIKLDGAFMRQLNDKSKEIVSSVINMAKKLGMHTLAEGVETRAQYDFLYEIGCEKIQGYYYGRPLLLDEQIINLEMQAMGWENQSDEELYDQLSSLQITSHSRLFLIGDDGQKLKVLYLSKKIKRMLDQGGYRTDFEFIDQIINNSLTSLGQKLKQAVMRVHQDVSPVNLILTWDNTYRLHFTLRKVASLATRQIYLLVLDEVLQK
ncbi:EAL domain-containing protein [Ligilactobacillus equi]|uniref:EAL domain-containing protein n=1 Tax=Ligilactobacillus equi TaxID=137357 RepID=UPI002ED37456